MTFRAWARALCLLPLLVASILPATAAASSASSTPTQAVAPLQTGSGTNKAGLTREVFGYATAGSLGDSTIGYPSWNFDLLSTVAFFALHLNYNGTLNTGDGNWAVWNSSTLTGLVSTAHAHGVKVVVSIVGPGSADLCNALYHDSVAVNAIVQQVQAKGVDGVNIDIESQLAQCNPTDPQFTPQTNQTLLTWFARDLRAGLDAAKPGYYLSIATYSGSALGNDGFFNIPDLNQYVDSFFVMAYDMDYSNQKHPPLNCSKFCMAPVSPLTSYFWNDTDSMAQYANVVGANKVILGQPYYARVSCVATVSAHATAITSVQAASYTQAKAAMSSTDVKPGTYRVHLDPDDPAGKDRWDAWYDNKYSCWRVMHWSDANTLSTRYDLVLQQNLRGVGFWTLNYGAGSPELWTAIRNHFMGCSGVTASGDPASPVLGGTTVAVSATSICPDPSPLYEFWVKAPGSSVYKVAQAYSTSDTLHWNTTGLAPGTYQLSVWVRDAQVPGIYGNASGRWDAYDAHLTYTVQSKPCSGVSATTAPATAAMKGMSVTLTASAPSCPTPLYEYWILPPGGTMYTLARSYSSDPAFAWSTTGLKTGVYRINVWVRDNSSLGRFGNKYGRWDAYNASLTYSVTAGCPSVTQSASPSGTAAAGTPVTVTAAAPGCSSPLYEFWILAPGAKLYTLKQAYGSSPTLAWDTTGLAPGTYRINVWVRDSTSAGVFGNTSGRWDAYNASLTFAVT